MSQGKKILQNISSLSLVQMVNYVFPLFTIPYLSRIIGPEGYGVINYATAFIAYFNLIIAYGFDLTATRKIAKNDTDINFISRVYSEVLVSRFYLFLISIVLFTICILVAKPLQKDIVVSVAVFCSTISLVLSPQFILQGLQDLKIFSYGNLIRGFLYLCLVFLFIKLPSDYYLIPVFNLMLMLLIAILYNVYVFKKHQLRFYWVSLRQCVDLLVEERTIFFSTVVINLYTTSNVVILGFFVDEKQIGYYTTAYILVNIVNSILSAPISTSIYPFISKAFGESKEKGIQTVRLIAPMVVYLTFIASLGLCLLAPLVVHVLYGQRFESSVLYLRILAFLPFIICLSNLPGIQVMMNVGMDKLFLKITTFCSIVGVTTNLFLSHFYGNLGAAWNLIIVELLVSFLMILMLLHKGIQIFDQNIWKPIEVFRIFKHRLLNK